jgi:hypothetical protein
LSPQKILLPQRLAGIVTKPCREDQRRVVFHAQMSLKRPSVFAAKLSGNLCYPRQTFWQRACARHDEAQGQKLVLDFA